MPNRDGTGPQGQGSLTGRGNGSCGNGNGLGGRMGLGNGVGFHSRIDASSKEELELLESRFEEKLVAVREALAKIKGEK